MFILRKGNAARKSLDAIEKKIAGLYADIERIEGDLYPREETCERIARDLGPAIKSGANWVGEYGSPWGQPHLPHDLQFGEVAALLSAMFGPEALEKGIKKLVESSTQGREPGLGLVARRKKIAELREQIRQAEIECERETLRIEAEGHTVLRRRNADVAAMLLVWDEHKEASPE